MQSKLHPKEHFKMLLGNLVEVIRTATSRGLDMPQDDSEDVLNCGYTYGQGIPDIFKRIMGWWVGQIDYLIDQCQEDPQLYSYFMAQRGLTYAEFLLLLDPSVKESEFRDHRLFSFLMIVDDIHRRAYLHHLPNVQEDPFSVYVDLLNSYEIPITSFFLHTKVPLYFPLSAVRKHIYIVSQSGAGKSELMKLLFYDLQRKSGKKHKYSLALLDPHGDLSWEVLGYVLNRKKQKSRIIYINPTIHKRLGINEVYSPTLNIFDIPNKEEETIDAFSQEITNAISEMIQKPSNAADAFSTNMDAFLKPCIATLLRMGNTDIRDLKRFMDDENNEDLVLIGQQSPDEEHRNFFLSNFNNKRYKPTKDAVFIKLQSLLNSPVFRRLTVGASTVDLEKAINSGKVVIFDFPKGRGRKSAADFGRLMVAYIQAIALRRQDIPKKFRKQTFFFIDEFHNFIGNSIKEIMAESRKYGLSLVLAHQVVGQEMPASLMDIILSNASLKIVGKNAKKSLEAMGANIDIPLEQLKKIPKYEFYVHNKDKEYPALLMKSPSFLVKQQDEYNQFYMSDEEKKELLRYMVYESGYYKKIDHPVLSENLSALPESTGLLNRIGNKRSQIDEEMPIQPAHDL